MNLRKLTITPLLLAVLLAGSVGAETGVQAWVQRYTGPGHTTENANALAVDGNNDVVVTGESSTSANANFDYATVKYSSGGGAMWTNRYNGPGDGTDDAVALVVDGNNDVIVTGYSTGSGSGYDYATIKYSSAGVALWTNRYNGAASGDDRAAGVAVDGSNNVVVTGRSVGSGGYTNFTTIKYSSAGVPLWTNFYNGTGNGADSAVGVAVDGSDHIVVTGISASGGIGADYATIKYSGAGVPLWTNRYNNPANTDDHVNAVTVDSSNSVVVTGWSGGAGGSYDYVTVKYSSVGVPLWTNRYNGPASSYDFAIAVATDGSNDVIVTGESIRSGGDFDYATVKYSSAGIPLWTNRYNGPGNLDDWVPALAVDRHNNVVVTGRSPGAGTGDEYATIKYSSAGSPVWTNRYSGPGKGSDQASAVAVDSSDNVIVTGQSVGTENDSDFMTIKYICVPSPVITNVNWTNGTCQMWVCDLLPAGTLVIEASTDLVTWEGVFTNTLPPGAILYTDPNASSNPQRFYRAFQFP